MEKTWRWFGKNDPITLDMLRQIGVEGIVTALHDKKNGEIWTYDEIIDIKDYVESKGLRWSVGESLPVSEAIKYGGQEIISNTTEDLKKCASAFVKVILILRYKPVQVAEVGPITDLCHTSMNFG